MHCNTVLNYIIRKHFSQRILFHSAYQMEYSQGMNQGYVVIKDLNALLQGLKERETKLNNTLQKQILLQLL